MKKLITHFTLAILLIGCPGWNSAKEILADNYSKVLAPGYSVAAGCQVPNGVVEPYLLAKFLKILKVDKELKKEAKMLEDMEDDAKKSGLDSSAQKGLIRTLCKSAVKHFAPVLAERGEEFPPELLAIGCSKEKLYQNSGDFMCGFAPANLTR